MGGTKESGELRCGSQGERGWEADAGQGSEAVQEPGYIPGVQAWLCLLQVV